MYKQGNTFTASTLYITHGESSLSVCYYTPARAISDLHALNQKAIGLRAWCMYIGYCTSRGV